VKERIYDPDFSARDHKASVRLGFRGVNQRHGRVLILRSSLVLVSLQQLYASQSAINSSPVPKFFLRRRAGEQGQDAGALPVACLKAKD